MTKRIKRRFIVFTMLTVTILLVFLVLAINCLTWTLLDQQSDAVMNALTDADNFHPVGDLNPPPSLFQPMDADRLRASRFFIVHFDPNDEVVDVNIDQIYAIDRETAEVYAARALDTGDTSGRMGRFKFAVRQFGPNRRVFFVDISVQIENFYTALFASSAIALLCWILLLILVLLLSGRVVRPVVVGIEKQKQFITNAGHEMKTPLAIIQSNNDTMALIHGENKYNVHIRNQTKRLNVLMANLLTLAKLDEEIPLATESVNMSNLAWEILPAYMELAQEQGLSFRTEIQQDIIIKGNPDSLRQLLTILLDNALKYTPSPGFIRVCIEKDGRYVRIVEENTCASVPESNPERLFERFYRGDSARTQGSDPAGYGIGLSAARAICESFSGTITAEYPTAETIRFTAKF